MCYGDDDDSSGMMENSWVFVNWKRREDRRKREARWNRLLWVWKLNDIGFRMLH